MQKLEYKLVFYNILASTLTLSIMNLFDFRDVYVLMLIYSINSAAVFGLLIYYELKYFKGLNINLVLLVGYSLRLVIPELEKSINALNGIDSFNIISDNLTTDFLFPTIVWMNIYYMLFYGCVLRFSPKVFIEDKIRFIFDRFNIPLISVPLFVIGIAYNILISYIPAGLIPSFITSIVGNFCSLAIVAQLFNTLFNYSKRNYFLFIAFIVVAVFQAIFFGFYKGAIMQDVLFYMVFYFLNKKYNGQALITPKFAFICVVFFAFLFLFVYPFMQTKRVVSGWGPESGYIAIYDYSNIEIAKDVLRGDVKFENTESGSRFDAVDANAFFYKESCRKNWHTNELLISNLELLVPRFLNPKKHNAEAGLMVTSYIFNGNFSQKDTALSSNYVGQFASAYLISGPILAILMALLNGWFISKYFSFLVKHSRNLITMVFLISFMLEALLAFEEIHDAGALRAGLYSVQMIGISVLDKFGIFSFKNVK